MLKRLYDWVAQCNQQQRDAFELALEPLCKDKVMKKNFTGRYQRRYHLSLLNKATLFAALTATGTPKKRPFWEPLPPATPERIFCDSLANGEGFIKKSQLKAGEKVAVEKLLQRGIVFEYKKHLCLPIEFMLELRHNKKGNATSWFSLTAKTPKKILEQLITDKGKQTLFQKPPLTNEMAAWLIAEGHRARCHNKPQQLSLSDRDWEFLLRTNYDDTNDFKFIQSFYPDLNPTEIIMEDHYIGTKNKRISLKASLENQIPPALKNLFRLGLIGVITQSNDNLSATLILCSEAQTLLKARLEQAKKNVTKHIEKQWEVAPSESEPDFPAYWSQDHKLWQCWVALHFQPLGITQAHKPRKADLKKIFKILAASDEETHNISVLIQQLFQCDFLISKERKLCAQAIDWKIWSANQRETMLDTLKNWQHWPTKTEQQAADLLCQLPVSTWLNVDQVVNWLRMKASSALSKAHWFELFTQSNGRSLHHLNTQTRAMFILPQFRNVLQRTAPSFPAPGWLGADKKAKVKGFISAAGEIQLPPDGQHSVLAKLAEFCTLSSIEHMITLQLDQAALRKMSTDKAALKRTRVLLESLQSPLPQAVAYLFDKQTSIKPMGEIAVTAMLITLHDPSAIHRLKKLGFELQQPFKDKPELVLLEASCDAHAFIEACTQEGLLFNSLIAPKHWISGTPCINAWMHMDKNREGQWLEVAYQKQRNSASKTLIACLMLDQYGYIQIQGTRQMKKGLQRLKTTVSLEPKHIIRLRELDAEETKTLGLEAL